MFTKTHFCCFSKKSYVKFVPNVHKRTLEINLLGMMILPLVIIWKGFNSEYCDLRHLYTVCCVYIVKESDFKGKAK